MFVVESGEKIEGGECEARKAEQEPSGKMGKMGKIGTRGREREREEVHVHASVV